MSDKATRDELLRALVEHCAAQPDPNAEAALLANQLAYKVRDYKADVQ